MDTLNSYGLIFVLVLGVLGAGFTFFNKQKYQTTQDIYQRGNDELRAQNKTLRQEKMDCEASTNVEKAKNEQLEIRIKELKELNSKQADIAQVVQLISSNHKEIISILGKKKR